MSVNYYGLNKEKYKEFFLTKTRETADLMQSMDTELAKFGINSRDLSSTVVWSIFECISSSADEDARQYMEEYEPETLSRRDSVYAYTSNREVKEKLETLTQAVQSLQIAVSELVPPPAQLDGYDDVALESEYCPTCESSTGACEIH
jgi:hypothetical protein